jgi:hypothetical protein
MDKKEITLELVKYRDPGLPTYTYFWTNSDGRVMSPYFNSPEEANAWLDTSWDNWKSNKDT